MTEKTAAAEVKEPRRAPAPGKARRMIGDPLAKLPKAVRDRLLRERPASAGRNGPAGAPEEVPEVDGVWGSEAAGVDSSYGTVLSASIKRKAEREKYPDNNGETTGYLFYDFASEGRVTCLVQGTLEPGDSFTIASVTLVVMDAEKQWENKGWSKYNVSVEKHDGVTLGA